MEMYNRLAGRNGSPLEKMKGGAALLGQQLISNGSEQQHINNGLVMELQRINNSGGRSIIDQWINNELEMKQKRIAEETTDQRIGDDISATAVNQQLTNELMTTTTNW
ncbi:hypothetical protein L1887_11866 [Cichorium endivia]|nr:hypothetical protein L1887_11866 [Cichorium endivia]